MCITCYFGGKSVYGDTKQILTWVEVNMQIYVLCGRGYWPSLRGQYPLEHKTYICIFTETKVNICFIITVPTVTWHPLHQSATVACSRNIRGYWPADNIYSTNVTFWGYPVLFLIMWQPLDQWGNRMMTSVIINLHIHLDPSQYLFNNYIVQHVPHIIFIQE